MMENVKKYQPGYFMPPTIDMSWAQKQFPERPQPGALLTCEMAIKH